MVDGMKSQTRCHSCCYQNSRERIPTGLISILGRKIPRGCYMEIEHTNFKELKHVSSSKKRKFSSTNNYVTVDNRIPSSRTKISKRIEFSKSSPRLKHTALLLILFFYHIQYVQAHPMQQEDITSSSLHRHLGRRERREVQKEILSVLGLTHRPRPDGEPARGLQEESAPLYMLGLYNTMSGYSDIFHARIQDSLSSTSDPSYPSKRESPSSLLRTEQNSRPMRMALSHSAGPFSDSWPNEVHIATNSAYYRYREAQTVFSNEIGVPEDGERLYFEGVTMEKRLLGDADVVMSFISRSFKVGRDEDEDDETRALLRRHRPFFFKLDQIPIEDALKGATFRIYKNMSGENMENSTLRVNVYQVKRDYHGQFSLQLLSSLRVQSGQEGWLSFDVHPAVRDWLNDANDNLGLRVSVETLEGRSLSLNKAGIVGGKRGDSSKRAFLVAFLTQGSKNLPHRLRKRMKRSALAPRPDQQDESDFDEDDSSLPDQVGSPAAPELDSKRITKRAGKERKRKTGKTKSRSRTNRIKHERGDSDSCHREKLYVSFQDLNWDAWIIAPAGYSAYHCIGVCAFPLNANMNATNHAIVQTLVHLLDPEKLRQPCCSPTKLDPISVLYYDDDNNVVFKKYKDMVVNACGCL